MAESALASQAQFEVTERRLRPLYDALDYGQHKKALQIAEKILKKQGDLQCAKILKSIALLRLSRTEEANDLVAKVMSTHPGDQASLQALTLFYRETGDFQKIAEVYSDAAKHYPKNQEILTHLFMAYVRVGDCQKQQQTAALLCKAFPYNGPYHCWRIMSILLQADDSPSLANNMFIPLAYKLIDKYFKENDIEAEAEVRLYLMVLERMGMMDMKLKVLQGSYGDKFKNQDEREMMIIETLQIRGHWKEASKKLSVLIKANPDWWTFIKQYIYCQVQLCSALYKDKATGSDSDRVSHSVKDPSLTKGCSQDTVATESVEQLHTLSSDGVTSTEDVVEPIPRESSEDRSDNTTGESREGNNKASTYYYDETSSDKTECTTVKSTWLQPLLEAQDFIYYLADNELNAFQEKSLSAIALRGPLLGRLELVKQITNLKEMGEAIQTPAPCQDLLMDYFRLFGTKSCVFDDLQSYVNSEVLPTDAIQRFLDQVEQEIYSDPVDFDCPPEMIKENLARLRRYVNLVQLQRYHGKHQVKIIEKKALVAKYAHDYREGIKLGKEFEDTTSQPADYFILIAAHITLELYQETGDIANLWEAVFMLESVTHHNAQVSLLLMKLYGHLGATECITDIFNTINIKHIQTETLGYFPGRYLQSMGTFGYANQLYRGAFRFFFNSSKEISEYIIQAYKNGVFHKIPEMIGLRDRLTHSFNFACTMVDMNVLELVTTVNNFPEAEVYFHKEWFRGMPYASSNLVEYCANLVDSRDIRVIDDWSPPPLRLTNLEIKVSFDLECLWLRMRVCLIKCLYAAVSCVSNSTEGTRNDKERATTRGCGLLKEQICDLAGILNAMDQHVGMMLLRQKSKCQLYPVQAPPPSLGYTFYQEGHGLILKQMLIIVEQVALGASSVEEDLKVILSKLQSAKSRIHGVSSDLREAMIKVVSPTFQNIEGDLITSNWTIDHPYDIITRKRIDLEEYVLFLQTISHLTLMCAVCAELSAPSTRGKKKKKKVDESKPVCNEFVNFMKELMVLLMSVSQSFQPFPLPPEGDDEQLSKQLTDLFISRSKSSPTGAVYVDEGGSTSDDSADSRVKDWDASVSKACAGVISSYNMSFRDTLEVVTAKLQFMRAIVKQLGGNLN